MAVRAPALLEDLDPARREEDEPVTPILGIGIELLMVEEPLLLIQVLAHPNHKRGRLARHRAIEILLEGIFLLGAIRVLLAIRLRISADDGAVVEARDEIWVRLKEHGLLLELAVVSPEVIPLTNREVLPRTTGKKVCVVLITEIVFTIKEVEVLWELRLDPLHDLTGIVGRAVLADPHFIREVTLLHQNSPEATLNVGSVIIDGDND